MHILISKTALKKNDKPEFSISVCVGTEGTCREK